ncbi:MarR family transcriptional regulator [Sphingomonas sp. KR1UV-12]|uniref:MarR family transcriptional regulator n=1 Tax=Sphingomonas aurea TaxID=3063994 RepID=A0ABT9EGP8_9SPHN|nr:MarR family transcriptional regulator [Sphingomonas sp. KR1UV-12]MDP1026142.1 MarR family transcriptional regulator [Sphingomonas sp. KR1UV-12]
MNDDLAFLIGDVSRLMRRRFDERARQVGATRQQWRVLLKLARHEGATQGTLAELLEVEPITLCRMVDRLADAGLVERRRDPADRRAWNIFLTERAHPMLDRLRGVADDLFGEVLGGIDAAALAAMKDTLGQLHTNLQAASPKEKAHG